MSKEKSSKSKIQHRTTVHSEKDLTICLVAGGAGFIGSHICEQLLSQNCFVYCLDNFSTGRKENIAYLSSKENFQVLDKDLNEVKKMSLPKNPDYIFHLAGVEAYINGVDIDLNTLLVNSFGSKNLLELAQESGAKFLLGSSIKVESGFLGESSLKNYFGKSRTNEGAAVFNEAKRFSEALTVEYASKYGLDARVVRLGFLYGPRMNLESGSTLSVLIKEALTKKPLTIFGDGLTKIYPTFISDAVYGVVKSMFSQSSRAKIYTLVNPESATLLNIAYSLRELSNENLEIEYVAGKSELDNIFPLQEEIIKSQEELGWYPKINFKSGLGETLNWFKMAKKSGKNVGRASKVEKAQKIKPPQKSPIPSALAEKHPAFPSNKTPLAKMRQTQSTLLSFLKFRKEKTESIFEKESIPKQKKNISLLGKALNNRQTDFKSGHKKLVVSNHFKTLILGITFFLSLIVFILSPFLLLAFFGIRGAKNLEQVNIALKEKNWLEVKSRAITAKDSFLRAQKTLAIIDLVFGKVGFSQKVAPANKLLGIGENIAQSIEHLWEAGVYAQELSYVILGQKVGDTRTLISQIQLELSKTNELLGFAQSQLQDGSLSYGEVKELGLDEKLNLLSKEIPHWRESLNLAQTSLSILPDILSLEGKKTYLLLLQNNHELRPTGGFIGSYGLIIFEKGRLLDVKIEDVYTADGQLKGHVEPPGEIKKYLGEATWFLRDSNFSPDFPTSAARAGWFLEKEMGRKVDGVIGVNLYLIQNILKVTGPVLVPDYNEEINSDNLFERAEYHAEINFFPGSTQKKDFLNSLTTQLFERLKQIQLHQLPDLASAILTSFEQKAIMLWLPETGAAKILTQFGWDGILRAPPIGIPKFPEETIRDYLMVAEANFGVNKSNFFVKRSAVTEITINGKTGEMLEKTTLSLKNDSPSEAWPGGIYKNYLRFLLPMTSETISIRVSTRSNGTPDTNVSSKNVQQIVESGKKSIGFLVEIPAKEERKIEIVYKPKEVFDLKKPSQTYLFYWQKQSGIGDDPIKLTINYPVFLRPVKLSQEATLKEGSLSFSSTLEKDRIFAVAFEH